MVRIGGGDAEVSGNISPVLQPGTPAPGTGNERKNTLHCVP